MISCYIFLEFHVKQQVNIMRTDLVSMKPTKWTERSENRGSTAVSGRDFLFFTVTRQVLEPNHSICLVPGALSQEEERTELEANHLFSFSVQLKNV
jgi:hypothetical protein